MRTYRTLLSTLIAGVLALPGFAAATDSNSIDWSAVRAEQQDFRTKAALQRKQKAGTDLAEFRISATGWYRVDHEDLLAAGIDLSGSNARKLALLDGDRQVPMIVRGGAKFGPGSSLEFFASAVEGNLYTNTAIYHLALEGKEALRFRNVGVAASGAALVSVPSSVMVAPDRAYNYSAPGDDPWSAARLVRSGASVARHVEPFDASPGATAATARIEVTLAGGLDYMSGGDDHRVHLLLNGVEIGVAQFDGLVAHTFETTLPIQQLNDGHNEFTIELLSDTGFASDVVYLEGFRIDYLRNLSLDETAIRFPVDASSTRNRSYVVAGSGDDVIVLRHRGATIDMIEGNVQADGSYRFGVSPQAGDEITVLRPSLAMTPEIAAAVPVSDPIAGAETEFLIVSHPSFMDGLTPLVAARNQQGISTRVVDVEDIYRYYNGGRPGPEAIQAALANAVTRLQTRYVLLVGGDSFDYKDNFGLGSLSFIPTHYVATSPDLRFAPSDAMYGDVDLDGDFDIAVGRLPARTLSELDAMIAKTLAYSSTPFVGKALMTTDRADPGYSFRAASLAMEQQLGEQWSFARVDVDDYAPNNVAAARAALASGIQSGQALVSFYGHGFPTKWGNSNLLSSGDLSAIAGAPSTVFVQFGCWGTYFVDPRQQALANALLAAPGGAAALIGQSGLTYIFSDLELSRVLLPKLAQMRIGDALVATANELTAEGSYPDVTLGTQLLGDPTLELRVH